jgi:predicted nucleic acid-binding Zn ribbon protein
MTENPETHCPDCGGRAKKLIGGGLGIIFKGSGFYVTVS